MTQVDTLVAGIRSAINGLADARISTTQVRDDLRTVLIAAGIDEAPRFITAEEQSSDGREYVLFRVFTYLSREEPHEFILPYTDAMKAYLGSHTRRKARATLVNEIVEFNQGVNEFYRSPAPQRVDAERVEYILNMNNTGGRFRDDEESLRREKIAALAILGAQSGNTYGPFYSRAMSGEVLGREGRYGIAETFEFHLDDVIAPDYYGYAAYESSIYDDDVEDDDDNEYFPYSDGEI